jgi:uncharacterized protein (DUF952 family)
VSIILHITQRTNWEKDSVDYQTESLVTEGFIHCSTPEQVLPVANAVFKGQSDLVLLVIDPQKLTFPLKYEAPVQTLTANPEQEIQQRFPHLYGPLNRDAVIKVISFTPLKDGTFTLPPL